MCHLTGNLKPNTRWTITTHKQTNFTIDSLKISGRAKNYIREAQHHMKYSLSMCPVDSRLPKTSPQDQESPIFHLSNHLHPSSSNAMNSSFQCRGPSGFWWRKSFNLLFQLPNSPCGRKRASGVLLAQGHNKPRLTTSVQSTQMRLIGLYCFVIWKVAKHEKLLKEFPDVFLPFWSSSEYRILFPRDLNTYNFTRGTPAHNDLIRVKVYNELLQPLSP